jgi:hypothetical protein
VQAANIEALRQLNPEPRYVVGASKPSYDVTPQQPVELPRRTSAYRKASVCNGPAPSSDKVLPCCPAKDDGSFSVELDATVSVNPFFSYPHDRLSGTTQQQLRFYAILSLERIGDPIGGNLSVDA